MATICTSVFTRPNESPNHLSTLRELIESEEREIHLVVSHMSSDAGISAALNRAMERGVTVRAIVRCDHPGHGIVVPPSSSSVLHICPGGFGNRIHTKYFTFEKARLAGKSVEKATVVGSFTVKRGSAKKCENLLCIEDEALYGHFLVHWSDMAQRAVRKAGRVCARDLSDSSLARDCSRTGMSSDGLATAYFFPFSRSSPVRQALRSVSGRTNGLELPLIRIAMARWTTAQVGLLTDIESAVTSGARCWMVLRKDPANTSGVHSSIIRRVKVLRQRFPERVRIATPRIGSTRNVHSKYFMYEGFQGTAPQWERIVYTGSVNWTDAGFRRNDEVLIRVNDPSTYDAYASDFERLLTGG